MPNWSDIGNGLVGLTIGGVSVGAVALLALRIINGQRKATIDINTAGDAQKANTSLINHFNAEIDRLTRSLSKQGEDHLKFRDEMAERIEKMAKERNDAVKDSGRQAERITALEDRLGVLEEELRKAEQSSNRAWSLVMKIHDTHVAAPNSETLDDVIRHAVEEARLATA